MLVLHKVLCSFPKERLAARAAQSAAARGLLLNVTEKLGIKPSPILKTEKGRPYFKDLPLVDFSLAHTDGIAVCALWQADGELSPRVGIDVEHITHFDSKKISAFAARFFGTHERSYVLAAKDQAAAFTEVFVKKEAFAKYRGDGIGAHFSHTDTYAPDFEATHGVCFHAARDGDYFISLCVTSTCAEPPLSFDEI